MKFEGNPYERLIGSDRLKSPLLLAATVVFLLISAFAIVYWGMVAGIVLFSIPFILAYVYFLLKNPAIGLFTAVIAGFISIGIGRYIPGIPIGLTMDCILIATYIALFFNKFYEKMDWSPVKKDITLLATIWFGYSVFELFNPEASSLAAWFSGRGIGFYMFLLVPLTLFYIDDQKKLNLFFYIWGIFSILVTLKGIMQVEWGIDYAERAWLNEGNYKTHIIFGKLRAFSFLSDAGQFGANQAYSSVVAGILAIGFKDWRRRIFFGIVALLALYGMIISGTRGAMSVPIAGMGLFIILRKNKTMLIGGIIILLAVIYFFKFTTIGQGSYYIRRMRTAFDLNDASLQVRLQNQRILRAYMATRPFGGGIGHGGVKAQRYLPNAFLSQVPTDSWYVLIWVEQGIVGLILHLFILFYVLIKSSYKIMFRIRDPILKMKLSALASGMFGVMVASYGNAVLGQMPTSILIYISMALLLNSEVFDKDQKLNTRFV